MTRVMDGDELGEGTARPAGQDSDLTSLLRRLDRLGVYLRVEDGRLVCDAPQNVVTPELLEELREHRDQLLQLLAASSGADPGEKRAPSSDAQRRFWYVEQLTPGTVVHNLPAAFRLEGVLDTAALERAVGEIIRRHEPLRTTFDSSGEELIQVIAPNADFQLPQVDFTTVPGDERAEKVQRWIDTRKEVPFDIASGPLFRATLLRVGEQENVLFVMPHHLVFDGWSFDVFLDELCVLYEAFTTDQASPLPELTVNYRDCCHDGGPSSQSRQQSADYWREQLAEAEPSLYVPADRAPPAELQNRGARESLELSESLVERLSTLAQARGATLFMVLLAGLKTLLHRYSDEQDIIVGVPVQSRLQSGTERLIGAFVNTMVLRTEVNPDLTFEQLIERLRDTCVTAYSHQATPIDQVLEDLGTRRDLSQTPLYRLLFSFQQAASRRTQMGGLRLSQLPACRHINFAGGIDDLVDADAKRYRGWR